MARIIELNKLFRCFIEKKIFTVILAAAIVSLVTANDDFTQWVGDPIVKRIGPEVKALGIRLGRFLLSPQLVASLAHDDNVYATDRDQVDDFITLWSPSVKVEYTGDVYSVMLGAEGSLGRYADNGAEDFDDFTVTINNHWRLSPISDLRMALRYDMLHELRASPDDVNGLSPTEFQVASFLTTYQHSFGPFLLHIDGVYKEADYKDVATLSGIINNDDRDRNETAATIRVAYRRGLEREMFIQGAVDQRAYDVSQDDNGLARSSKGYGLAIGGVIGTPGLVRTEGFVGYNGRKYDDVRFSQLEDLWLSGKLRWNISDLTSMTVSTDRTLKETTFANSPGYSATRVGVALDHEMLRNLSLQLDLSTQNNEYENIDREEDLYNASFSAKYVMNRRMQVELRNTWRQRDSQQSVPQVSNDYEGNTVSLQIQVQL